MAPDPRRGAREPIGRAGGDPQDGEADQGAQRRRKRPSRACPSVPIVRRKGSPRRRSSCRTTCRRDPRVPLTATGGGEGRSSPRVGGHALHPRDAGDVRGRRSKAVGSRRAPAAAVRARSATPWRAGKAVRPPAPQVRQADAVGDEPRRAGEAVEARSSRTNVSVVDTIGVAEPAQVPSQALKGLGIDGQPTIIGGPG